MKKKIVILNEITKNPEILNSFYMLSCKILIRQEKSNIWINFYCHHNFFLLKNTFKVHLQHLLNVVILLSIVFNLKHNFKLKID